MEIIKSQQNEYHVGILWNMSSRYAREIMLKIAIMEDVIQVRVYDLKDKYEDFVLECYNGDKEAYDGGYIFEKIENMRTGNNRIVAFIININAPTYKNSSDGKSQCTESRRIKQKIRELFANRIDGYFFDNLIHMSDDPDEAKKTIKVLKKYENFTVADYVKRGYQPVMSKRESKDKKREKKTYIDLLKELRDER